MPYLALYRKHRPQLFSEIVGQGHVTETLVKEVAEGKVAHAYLFAGPRGTGKTSTARVLAKALNCTDRSADGEPCNKCTSCAGVTEGTSLDVIELDAASHNKVEDVREMRVNAGTVASVGGASRVYILDEAHMLSRAAANALLKILEEPPDHVYFVLATTEPYKLPDTIRSRAQRFDFHPVSHEVLTSHTKAIAEQEGFGLEPDAVALIADHARGSARDALSLLEQVAALGGGTVSPELVARALGLADREAYGRLAEAIAQGDAPAALGLVAEMASEGADLRRFVAEGLEFFRGLFLAQYAPNLEEVVDEPRDTIDVWRHHARGLATADVLRAIDQLSEALVQLREGREERLVVELTLLRLTRPETAADPATLAARIDRLEDRFRKGIPKAADKPAPEAPQPEEPEPAEAEESSSRPEPDAAAEEETESQAEVPEPLEGLELDVVEASWPAIVARLRDEAGPRRHALFRETIPVAVEAGATVVLGVPGHLPFHLEQLRNDRALQLAVESVGAELLGGGIRIEYREAVVEEKPVADEKEERAPNADDLDEAPEGADDPTTLVVDAFKGEVVSEEPAT